MRVALVHDWLTGMRGGEKVLECLCEIFPEAPVYTLVHVPGSVSPIIESRDITTSFLQRLPGSYRHYRALLPLFPAAIESFDLRGFDLVVSSSHAVAKGIIPGPRTTHVSYVHTPMRYVWDLMPEYAARSGRLTRAALRLAGPWLRAWDVAASTRVDTFIANSHHVAARIKRYYGREAQVVHPPVDTDFYTPGDEAPREHLLIVSALVPYKNIELAIAAVRGTAHRLVIAGEGPSRARLQAVAGPEVSFVGRLTNEQLRDLYRRASAFILPGEEDFGIAALEAQACGTPVVAYARGGALETVVDGRTGLLCGEAEPEALAKAIDTALRIPFNRETLRAHALGFSRARFVTDFQAALGPWLGA